MASDRRELSLNLQKLVGPVFDLFLTAGLIVVCAIAAVHPDLFGSPIRAVVALPLMFFLPGYALIAALFPSRAAPTATDDSTRRAFSATRSVEPLTRVALSVLGSLTLAPLVGFGLNFTPWGIQLVPFVVSLAALTVAASLLGVLRRLSLPSERRFSPSVGRYKGVVRTKLFRTESGSVSLLNVLLAVSILAAMATAVYTVAVVPRGEEHTEFHLLTQDGSGETVADEYPTEFATGDRKPIIVGIDNEEQRTTTYSVIVELQRTENGSTSTVAERERLAEFQTTLASNEKARRSVELAPSLLGRDLRLTFLLYRGNPPPNPSVESAYRQTHLWIDVGEQHVSSETVSIDEPNRVALDSKLLRVEDGR